MDQSGWVGAGHNEYVPGMMDNIPEFDPRSGDHLWTIFVIYRWGGPHIETPTLDNENRLGVMGPGCFYCEEIYKPAIAKRRCKGR